MGNSPGNWDWQSNLRDIASGGHNVGDIVNGWRWDGVGWHQEGGGGGGGGGSTGGGGNGDAVFGAAKTALTDRYNNLIAQIQGNQTTATNRQTVTTNNELGKRGILSSSGVAQQEMTNALQPVTSEYTGLMNTATGAYNTDIANLAISQYTGQQTANQNAINNAMKEKQLNYDINKPYYAPSTATGGGGGITGLLAGMGGTGNKNTPTPSFQTIKDYSYLNNTKGVTFSPNTPPKNTSVLGSIFGNLFGGFGSSW